MSSLATLPRSRAPLVIPRSPARSRVLAAANELQRAIDGLFEEAKEQARERAKRDTENERKVQAHLAKTKARLATKEYRIEVSKKWLEEFATDALDAMHAQMTTAKATGHHAFANQIGDRADHLVADLTKLGVIERPKEIKS